MLLLDYFLPPAPAPASFLFASSLGSDLLSVLDFLADHAQPNVTF